MLQLRHQLLQSRVRRGSQGSSTQTTLREPYNKLKAELIKRTAASEQHKLQQLISGEELGDCKPTQLLRQMQQLLGDKLGKSADANSYLRELFLQCLPPNIQMVLASTDASMDLNKLADIADKVMEVATTNVAEISDTSEVKQLREEVARLADLVASLTTRSRCRSSSRPVAHTVQLN